jgi:membrane fusion protein (multidrug efflux system)
LRDDETVSELEMLRVRAEAQKLRASADAVRFEVTRLDRERAHRQSERETRLREVERDTAALEGAIATSTATVALITQQLADYRVCAPVSGIVGEVCELHPGTVVVPGEKLGAVIPAGDLCIVAQFAPADAIGRLKGGQHAQVRLDAFPWIQHGMLAATVRTVASEVRDGRVRVELDIAGSLASGVGLEHGLTGSVAVAVDSISPALLVTRVTGEWFRRGAGTFER